MSPSAADGDRRTIATYNRAVSASPGSDEIEVKRDANERSGTRRSYAAQTGQREGWFAARLDLVEGEKELRKRKDGLRRRRRGLPRPRIASRRLRDHSIGIAFRFSRPKYEVGERTTLGVVATPTAVAAGLAYVRRWFAPPATAKRTGLERYASRWPVPDKGIRARVKGGVTWCISPLTDIGHSSTKTEVSTAAGLHDDSNTYCSIVGGGNSAER